MTADQRPAGHRAAPARAPTAGAGRLGRRALLAGALATTAGVGALSLADVVPWPRGDVDLTWLAERLGSDPALSVVEEPGWADRGRPFGGFAPVGVLMHHTAFRASTEEPSPALATVRDGREGLAGPLCHVLVDRVGACHVIAAGRASHAGESVESGPVPGGDGNVHYVGIEIDYAPQEPYGQSPTDAQGAAAIAAAAAIVSGLGRDAAHVRFHAETSTAGKWDPGGWLSADDFRAQVAAVLAERWA